MKNLKEKTMKLVAAAASAAALCSFLVAVTPTVAAARDRDDGHAAERWHREAPRERAYTWTRTYRAPVREGYPVVCDHDGDDCVPAYNSPAYTYYPVLPGWF